MARSALIVLMALGMTAAHPSIRRGMSRSDPASVRNLTILEFDFRGSDRSGNRIQDFWTCCIAGIYGVLPPGERCSWRCGVKAWMDRHVPRIADLLIRLLGSGANPRERVEADEFFIADVGLYTLSPPDPLEMVKLLEISVAGFDSSPDDANSSPSPAGEMLRTQSGEDDP